MSDKVPHSWQEMSNLLTNKRVEQFGNIGTIVGYTEKQSPTSSDSISVKWETGRDAGAIKQYQFPDVFLNKRYGMSVTDTSKRLSKLLNIQLCSHTCSICGEYSAEIYTFNNKLICKKCKENSQQCNECGEYKCKSEVRLSLDGKYRCAKCLEARYPHIAKNFSVPSTAPTLYVRKVFPYNCTHHHRMFCVTAKVVVRNNTRYYFAHINLHFCETCDKYYIPLTTWNDYNEKFGYICLPRNVAETHSSSNPKTFQESTLLSRWGYSTSLSTPERRNILMSIVDAGCDHNYKSQVVSILSSFVCNRHWQPDAVTIWREDLYFIEQYNASNQRMIDLSVLKDLL